VLDDWKKGFSIHKLDLDDGSDGIDLTERAPAHRQSNEHVHWSFAAVRSKIVAAGRLNHSVDDCVTTVYDTETAGVSIVSGIPAVLRHGWELAAAAGNRLYTVVNGLWDGGGMHCLEEDAEDQWSWSSMPSPLPFCVSRMESIAAHPAEGGGRILFVSMGEKDHDIYMVAEAEHLGQDMQSRTYSYDAGSGEWRGHGDWDLPFYGQAHYDGGLDAWVGLHKAPEPRYGIHMRPDGYICSCDVVSPAAARSPAMQPPPWKKCTERLSDSYLRDGSLVYMGDSTYCVVEVVERERFRRRRCATTGSKSMIRLTTFSLEYGKSGELTITARQPDRSYLFSSYGEHFQVRAFWL
jgi:hypothetical protein